MSAHTPGPWEVVVVSDGWDGKTTAIVNEAGDHILSGLGYDACGLSWGQSKLEMTPEEECQLPDAHLIAAAPEMYEALKEMAIWYGSENHSFRCPVSTEGWDATCNCKVAEMDVRVNAALAKAEGSV